MFILYILEENTHDLIFLVFMYFFSQNLYLKIIMNQTAVQINTKKTNRPGTV